MPAGTYYCPRQLLTRGCCSQTSACLSATAAALPQLAPGLTEASCVCLNVYRLDYEEEDEQQEAGVKSGAEKKGYVGIHAVGFKELMLKPELLQATTDCGFEHPSEGARGAGKGG